jgi:hypothetical protein
MQTSMPSTSKHCATCEYWSGARTPESLNKWVKYDSKEASKCLGKMKGYSKSSTDSCSHWVKWAILK